MTINGGQPHKVGYRGQKYVTTVVEADGVRRKVCWGDDPTPDHVLRSLELHPGWTDAQCTEVQNRETGD